MCAVHTSRTEVEALSALIARVNSSLDTAEVLDQATEVCIALVGCAGALVYLWDEEQERLVIGVRPRATATGSACSRSHSGRG